MAKGLVIRPDQMRLIEAVYAAAEATGAFSAYWHTQEFNADGWALYDTLARRTSLQARADRTSE